MNKEDWLDVALAVGIGVALAVLAVMGLSA